MEFYEIHWMQFLDTELRGKKKPQALGKLKERFFLFFFQNEKCQVAGA